MVLKQAGGIDYSKPRPNYSHMKMVHGERCCLGYRCYCQGNACEQKNIKSAKGSACIISNKANTSHGLSIAAGYQNLVYQAQFPCGSHSFLDYGSLRMPYLCLIVRTKVFLDLLLGLLYMARKIQLLHLEKKVNYIVFVSRSYETFDQYNSSVPESP